MICKENKNRNKEDQRVLRTMIYVNPTPTMTLRYLSIAQIRCSMKWLRDRVFWEIFHIFLGTHTWACTVSIYRKFTWQTLHNMTKGIPTHTQFVTTKWYLEYSDMCELLYALEWRMTFSNTIFFLFSWFFCFSNFSWKLNW